MEKEIFLTKEKHKELTEELDHLKNTRRKEIADRLEYARSLGDLSENAEYHEARSLQAEVEARIRELEHVLKFAKIVNHKKTAEVEIGSTAVVKKSRSTTEQEFTIVGSHESDMLAGRISYTSPLGQVLMGKKKGEKVTLETPRGKTTYTIVKVK